MQATKAKKIINKINNYFFNHRRKSFQYSYIFYKILEKKRNIVARKYKQDFSLSQWSSKINHDLKFVNKLMHYTHDICNFYNIFHDITRIFHIYFYFTRLFLLTAIKRLFIFANVINRNHLISNWFRLLLIAKINIRFIAVNDRVIAAF